MSANFPTSIPSIAAANASDTLAVAQHTAKHNQMALEIAALGTKVGVDSSAVTSTHDYKLSGVTGTDKAVSKTGVETLTNKTLSSPVINSPTGDVVTLTGNQTLTNKILTTPTIADLTNMQHTHASASSGGILGTSAIDTNAIAAANLATNAIKLGYTEHNADTSTSGTSETEITGVATTVTIPAGGRSVLVIFAGTVQNSGSANCYINLWDGAVSSGTLLTCSIVGLSLLMPIYMSVVLTPSAGSKTYRASFKTAAGTCSIRGANPPTASGNPGNPYILVLAI